MGPHLSGRRRRSARDQQGPPIRLRLLNQAGPDDRQETWSAHGLTGTTWAASPPRRTPPRLGPRT
ncbi:hypothetical protein ACFY19_04285 [Streptosporangium saharense]|uniref:hypothetical protein n=1 Tax=Streptosporangium saharense TaxID=1706840 RepID=UPI0036B18E47